MAKAGTCSVSGCKRAVTCLCHHCKKNVCSKHFNEHQAEINNELLPLTDRLNELKMKLADKQIRNDSMVVLNTWRDQKYQEIDEEYNQKVTEYDGKIADKTDEVSQITEKVAELIKEGEASASQIKQLKKEIEMMEEQVNRLMTSEQRQVSPRQNSMIAESDLVNRYVQLARYKYFVKGKVFCQGQDLYALESEISLVGYDGLCPKCGAMHVPLKPKRGFYVSCQTLHERMRTDLDK